MRSHHGDQAIPPQFRKFSGNRLDGETKVVGDVEAPEWKVDLDRGHGVRAGPPRDMEEEGGDPLIGSRPTKAHDLILRSRHFTGDLGEKLRAQIPAAVDQFMEAVPRKPSKPDRGHGFRRERIDVAERHAEELASVAEAKNGAPAIVHDAIQPKAALQHMKDVRGLVPFPEDRPGRREGLGDLRKKESLQGRRSGASSRTAPSDEARKSGGWVAG